MDTLQLDALDRKLLRLMQSDARAPMTEMGKQLSVSGNTVRNRISNLEANGVITGYTIEVEYAPAGFPFHYQLSCSTPIADRANLAEAALEIPGVVEVRELMTGQNNLLVEVIGRDQDDITRIAQSLNDVGIEVVDETMIKRRKRHPITFDTGDEE